MMTKRDMDKLAAVGMYRASQHGCDGPTSWDQSSEVDGNCVADIADMSRWCVHCLLGQASILLEAQTSARATRSDSVVAEGVTSRERPAFGHPPRLPSADSGVEGVERVAGTPRQGVTAGETALSDDQIHRCRKCGTLWRRWSDGNYSLIENKAAGSCCDNAPMGAQIEQLWPPMVNLRIAYLEGTVIPHARKQEHANGFQAGWHAAIDRVQSGDKPDELKELIPDSRAEQQPIGREKEPHCDDCDNPAALCICAFRRLAEESEAGEAAHYFTPDPTKRFCVICGDNDIGSVWGIHRFQIQPHDPEFNSLNVRRK